MDYTNKTIADQSRNKVALIGTTIMNMVVAVAYFIEVLKGGRTIASYLIIVSLCVIPILGAFLLYFKKKDSVPIRYVLAIGFSFLYCYVMYGTTTNTSFCYVIVIFLVLIVYMDKKVSIGLGISAVAINIVRLVITIMRGELTPIYITEMEIVIACLVLSVILAVMSLNKISQINDANVQKAMKEKEQSEQLLSKIRQITDVMGQNMQHAAEETVVLRDSIETTKIAMENLSTGANTAAQAVITQQEHTGEIDEHIQKVGQGTEAVYHSALNSEDSLKKGQEIMASLLGHVENTEKINNLVAEEMTELRSKSEQMGSIVELINDVASQTELLALNASIEAARAGEAGKGFAVVASEITSLAGQTEDATGKIVQLIADIRESLDRVNQSVDEMLKSNHTQGELVEENAKSFDVIRDNTKEIMQEVTQLQRVVTTVENANRLVVDNISNVSAVTQEITAEANTTLEGCESNLRSIENVSSMINQLNQSAEELKQN